MDSQMYEVDIDMTNKKIIGWGTGSLFLKNVEKYNFDLAYIIDNDESKQGGSILGIDVKSPLALNEENPEEVIIVIYSSFFKEISKDVLAYGAFETISIYELIEKEVFSHSIEEREARAKAFWDEKRTYKGVDMNHWESNELINRIISERAYGSEHTNWIDYISDLYLKGKKNLAVLSLGCGTGLLERKIATQLDCEIIRAIDFSELSIHEARNLAEKEHMSCLIEYEVGNLNTITLPEQVYDLIVAEESIHHVENLEHLYTQVQKALKPDGLFIQSEFTGPDHFQWTDEQLEEINKILDTLDSKYKIKNFYERPRLIDMLANDPSEAVRSSEIIPLTYHYFKVIDRRELGGNIMHLLYQCLNVEYFGDNADRYCNHLLRSILEYEKQVFIEAGKSDTAFLVSRLYKDSDY